MKIRPLILCLAMLPMLAHAEVYKWKDKDGSVRYSDVPPPSNIKHEPMLGKKPPKPTGQPPLASVEGDITSAINRDKAATEKAAAGKSSLSKDEAAAKRAKDADVQKKENEVKQAELKLRQENCKISKANLETYTHGGRIATTNEKGEREYLGDAQISQGVVDAKKDVERYCD